MPPRLLETCKVVFVCRNVKVRTLSSTLPFFDVDVQDVCVSYYHHNRLFKTCDFDSEFLAFAELFKNSNISTGETTSTKKLMLAVLLLQGVISRC